MTTIPLPAWAVREPDETDRDWRLRLLVSGPPVTSRPVRDVWDDVTDAGADTLFATFTETQIRRRQELCHAQIRLAFRTRDEQGLANLQRMDDALTRAMLTRIPEWSVT